MHHRYFIKLAYNGARYHGWQIQDNAITVQQVITDAVKLMWSRDFRMIGCGRTDTGVSAKQFYAHFDLPDEKSREELSGLAHRLNRYLPEDIVIYDIFPVPPDLHSRYDAVFRTYEYHIHTRKDPFLNPMSWYVYPAPGVDRMNEACLVLKEYEDFTSFSKFNEKRKTNLCTILDAGWLKDDHRLIFHITANRFLHDMVRAIVGTMMDVGHQKITLEELRQIIESKDRCRAGESVPAKGLYLTRVEYPVAIG
ncbi:MAG: tRNA pseudouridine(38-40) synthase TruA [Bacteroidales bacterium]|nr:tRNA pseudouridine(38-40) synthase TruA [Bacteroidales bacterium]